MEILGHCFQFCQKWACRERPHHFQKNLQDYPKKIKTTYLGVVYISPFLGVITTSLGLSSSSSSYLYSCNHASYYDKGRRLEKH